MPSLRKPLSLRQKITAVYTNPDVYALADFVARQQGCDPAHPDYRRHVTCFLLDLEARVHTNRQKLDRNEADNRELHALRCELAWRVTGREMLLAQPPGSDDVRKWRYRWIPTLAAVEKAKLEGKTVVDVEARLRGFVDQHEQLAVSVVKQLRGFPRREGRNLAVFRKSNTCSADGTYVRAYSKVAEDEDPETGELMTLGSRSKREADGSQPNAIVQDHVNRTPKAGRETMGVNHVAILTRTRWGRVILTVQQALGGEVHAALRAMERVAPLAEGGIHALTYDKAMSGWQIDWLLAKLGIIAIAPPIAAKGKHPKVEEAERKAEAILADRQAQAAHTQTTKRGKEKPVSRATRDGLVSKVLKRLFDADQLLADAEAGQALGIGLPLGTSAYLDSNGKVIAVNSQPRYFDHCRHDRADGTACLHEVHVDDGGLWEVLEDFKQQRLQPVHAEAVRNTRTGWFELKTTYQYVCHKTGEVATREVTYVPSGLWRPQEENRPPKRSARQMMMLLAPCDAMWRKVYGLRGDCESWFSWLKMQLLDDKRAPSLELNHQLLDVFYAAIITNSITLFQARREGAV